jgi:hypothetical protein
MLTFGAGNIPKRTFITKLVDVLIVIGSVAELLFTIITPVNGTLISEDVNEYVEVVVDHRAFTPVCISTWLFVAS